MKSDSVGYGIMLALLAAALYAVNSPISKILLDYMPPTLMAGFLYVGAGVGITIIALIRKIRKTEHTEMKLTKRDLPYTVAMILLDIAAPVCLLFGLKSTTAANASLLNNFEIVATFIGTLLSFAFFPEMPDHTYFIAVGLMIIGAWLSSRDKPIFRKK